MIRDKRNMLRSCFEAGSLFLPVLWKGDTPIAAQAALIDNKKRSLICFAVSRDLIVKKPPPGFVLHLHSIRWAIQRGFTMYDLLMGNFAYKYNFGPEEHSVQCLLVSTKTGMNLRETLDKRSLPAAFAHVRALKDRGEIFEAEGGCRQILEVDPNHTGALQLLGEIEIGPDFRSAQHLYQVGRYAEADSMCRAVIAADPKHFEATHLLGVLLLHQREFEAAERQFGVAAEIRADVASVHNGRGVALRNLKRFGEALKHFDNAIALNAAYAQAYNNRGIVLRELNRLEEALASFDRAVALKPNYARASENRNVVMRELQHRDRFSTSMLASS
jgi:tetratricopeptide (TPR) repeat protein